jgi:cell shape-determining protein MreC
MIGFNLLTNFIEDLEALLKRTKAKLKRVSALESEDKRIRQNLTLEFSAPTIANYRVFVERQWSFRVFVNSLLQL